MNELIKALLAAGREDALESLAKFTEAAKSLGYTEDEVNEALDGFDGFPLDDDDLGDITGGGPVSLGVKLNKTTIKLG